MSQWFHRNSYKASGRPNFDLGPVATSIPARMLCSRLDERRQTLIKMFEDFDNSVEVMVQAANQYIALLMGIATAPCSAEAFNGSYGSDGADSEKGSDSEIPELGVTDATEQSAKDDKEKKKPKKTKKPPPEPKTEHSLRRLFSFTWTDSLDSKHKSPRSDRDANFELIGILVNLALWFSKHAAKIASNANIETKEAVDVHKSLRSAAGLFDYIKNNLSGQMMGKAEMGSDLDPHVLEAYILQCQAEAQEVTIARAMELKHDPGLIAALASETATLYEKCKCGLQILPEMLVSKWRAYCIFKMACFRAYAFCFQSESDLKADKCGAAIACAREALKYCTQAQSAAKVYRSGSGAEFCFVRRLQPYAQLTLSKAETENSMIYHQKVPATVPQLQLKATFGIATPEMPEGLNFTIDDSWQEAMPGFDTSKVLMWMTHKDYNWKRREAEKLRVIPESPIYQGDKDPNNASGCVIS